MALTQIESNAASFTRDVVDVRGELGDVPARLVKINVYEESSVATDLGVFGIPAFFLFRDGKKLGRMSEFRGVRFFVDVVREHLPAQAPA